MSELPDGIDVSALDDACEEYHREYASDRGAEKLIPRVAAIREALGQSRMHSHVVRELMDADRDYADLRATIVGDLRILADRQDVTTGDIHALADEIEGGGKWEPVPAAVTPEPAGPRVWGVGEKVPADVLRIRDESGCLWSRDGAAWVHSCQDLGAVRSRMADSFLRCSVRTEVPAVPPAEPGAGA